MRSTLKALIPLAVKRAMLAVLNWLDLRVAQVLARHGILASAYYLLFSRRFDREHLAVLRGRLAYERALKELGNSSPLLRRNIHRLEKGLIMRPRHPVFGEAYIAETVHCYDQAKKTPGFSEVELQWAADVLNEYFAVVGDSPVIRKAKTDYERCQDAIAASSSHPKSAFKPYLRGSSPATDISLESLSTLFERRRSVRWYQDKSVPIELIQKTINAALSAPSACNRQPFRFIVSNIPERASEIAKCAGGTTGYAENVPAIIVVVGDLSAYPKERDRHLIYIDSSLASMQLMLAAETLGLATCPINWPDVDKAEKSMQRLLNLPAHERVIMLISIGYGDPDGGIAYSQKKQGPTVITDLGQQ